MLSRVNLGRPSPGQEGYGNHGKNHPARRRQGRWGGPGKPPAPYRGYCCSNPVPVNDHPLCDQSKDNEKHPSWEPDILSLPFFTLHLHSLKDFPEKERELWRIFDQTPFEVLTALEEVRSEDVLKLLNYPAYFDLLKLPLPDTRDGILQALRTDNVIRKSESGKWNITNLGAILLAKKLSDFHSLRRKAVRVIAYKGNSRVDTIREQEGT